MVNKILIASDMCSFALSCHHLLFPCKNTKHSWEKHFGSCRNDSSVTLSITSPPLANAGLNTNHSGDGDLILEGLKKNHPLRETFNALNDTKHKWENIPKGFKNLSSQSNELNTNCF